MDLAEFGAQAIQILADNKDAIGTLKDSGEIIGMIGNTIVSGFSVGKKVVSVIARKRKEGEKGDKPATVKKNDVAIVVEISRHVADLVVIYLAEEKIDADIIFVTKSESEIVFLDEGKPDDWKTLVQDFSKVMNQVQKTMSHANVHIFMAAPMPIAFGAGAVWGTVSNATFYHFDGKSYQPVLEVDRELRQ